MDSKLQANAAAILIENLQVFEDATLLMKGYVNLLLEQAKLSCLKRLEEQFSWKVFKKYSLKTDGDQLLIQLDPEKDYYMCIFIGEKAEEKEKNKFPISTLIGINGRHESLLICLKKGAAYEEKQIWHNVYQQYPEKIEEIGKITEYALQQHTKFGWWHIPINDIDASTLAQLVRDEKMEDVYLSLEKKFDAFLAAFPLLVELFEAYMLKNAKA